MSIAKFPGFQIWPTAWRPRDSPFEPWLNSQVNVPLFWRTRSPSACLLPRRAFTFINDFTVWTEFFGRRKNHHKGESRCRYAAAHQLQQGVQNGWKEEESRAKGGTTHRRHPH